DLPVYGLLPLLQLVGEAVDLPLIAAGGIGSGRAIAAVLSAGARAAQLGTAFLRCPEAGTADVHRAALGSNAGTTLTRAFTGSRRGRRLQSVQRRVGGQRSQHRQLAALPAQHAAPEVVGTLAEWVFPVGGEVVPRPLLDLPLQLARLPARVPREDPELLDLVG